MGLAATTTDGFMPQNQVVVNFQMRARNEEPLSLPNRSVGIDFRWPKGADGSRNVTDRAARNGSDKPVTLIVAAKVLLLGATVSNEQQQMTLFGLGVDDFRDNVLG